eukprot:TRINITY_DN103332_c0_g1_i1.p1 TRINITY_DN103332_c0_g1~~TRINITY_DN103332_c0_g1_i1.p1  ORF type:complete len:195 (-),score=19.62 TRINITY_DN103332_c0_g1_i1:149-733(-)
MSNTLPIVLGSSSKWRKQVLSEHFTEYEFECVPPNIDEKAVRGDTPEATSVAVANAKLDKLIKEITKPCIIICGDQVIKFKGETREKPVDEEENKAFLRSYGNEVLECCSAVVMYNTQTKARVEAMETAKVYYKPIPEDVINKVVAKGETMWCSGGFMAEDEDLVPYMEKLEGELSCVQGMPLKTTGELLNKVK